MCLAVAIRVGCYATLSSARTSGQSREKGYCTFRNSGADLPSGTFPVSRAVERASSSCLWSIYLIPFCFLHLPQLFEALSYATTFCFCYVVTNMIKIYVFVCHLLSLMLNLFVREFSLSQTAINAR
jgi:hypothetical protein